MTNLFKIKRLYLWKSSICKTFWTTLVRQWLINRVLLCQHTEAPCRR